MVVASRAVTSSARRLVELSGRRVVDRRPGAARGYPVAERQASTADWNCR